MLFHEALPGFAAEIPLVKSTLKLRLGGVHAADGHEQAVQETPVPPFWPSVGREAWQFATSCVQLPHELSRYGPTKSKTNITHHHAKLLAARPCI